MNASADMPVALTIAGSDSCGGAGIQADLRTFAVHRVHGAAALTAITAQNTTGVQAADMVQPRLITAQIRSVASDLTIAATKTGMLGNRKTIQTVAAALQSYPSGPIVVDPVMVAKGGDPLIDDAAVSALADLLLPLAALVTPNRHEAARLLGIDPIDTLDAARDAAAAIVGQFDVPACVVKAIPDGDDIVDLFFTQNTPTPLRRPRVRSDRTHGSGCTYSAAITARLAHGHTLDEAVRAAGDFIQSAIENAPPLGRGISPVNPLAGLNG